MKKSITIAMITIFTLFLTGCLLNADVPKPEKQDVDIQYFTDRTDQFYEYASATNVAFVVTTEQGKYHFSDPEMPLDTVYEYIEAFDAGVKYAQEWFGQDNVMLDIYFIQRDLAAEYGSDDSGITGSGADGVVWVEYDSALELPPPTFLASHVLMHESIHALCDVHAETSNFPRRPEPYPFFWSELFEEGLATMLEHSYGYSSGRLHDVYMYHYTQGGSASSAGALDEANNIAEALNHLALFSLEEEEFYDELPYDILQSYYTSASFLYWLLDHGSKEDFRLVYADIGLMEEVYGKNMNDMIKEWLNYLGK